MLHRCRRARGPILVLASIHPRASSLVLAILALALVAGCRGCTSKADVVAVDAADDAAAMTTTDAYAVYAICEMRWQASPYEKPSRYGGDPLEYVKLELADTKSAVVRALLTRVLAAPPADRGAILRAAYTNVARPIVQDGGLPNLSAPTAPWGREDPAPEPDVRCALADALDMKP